MKFKENIPFYVQIREILQQEIIGGVYKDKIPSEIDLMERFDVSRSTVRQAISALVADGYLEKRHGKGTFVSFRPVVDWLGSFKTYREIVTEMGMKPYIHTVGKERINVSGKLKDVMGNSEAFLVRRIRYADDCPISIEENYYPIELIDLLENQEWENEASYLMLKRAGIVLWNAEQTIMSRMPTAEEAEILQMEKDCPILYIERQNYDVNQKLVEYERSVYRADKYSFVINFGLKS